ncbi:CBP80/20-dependent translation initiation factor [Grus japonensis]|uniref:CBP80/20-dependent translation initiation factor n=1 Tax=Grus japonensis TaxID=30415 RepID=A0ABC9Y917_GRUJA
MTSRGHFQPQLVCDSEAGCLHGQYVNLPTGPWWVVEIVDSGNGNKESSLDMLGTDIWAANTFDSFSGATWDLQPEKLDFTQFHRKLRNTSKHPLPHIEREG